MNQDPWNNPAIREFLIVGPPGCGKTEFLGQLVERAADQGLNVLVGSLTRAAAAELRSRRLSIPRENSGTVHSFCFRALGKPGLAQLADNLLEWNTSYPAYTMTPVDGEVGEANHEGRRSRGDELLSQYDIWRARMRTGPVSSQLETFITRWEAWKQSRNLLDFTDLIERCLDGVPTAPGNPDLILLDEAQDLSPMEVRLLRAWAARTRCLVMAGDPDQNLYSWRGSDSRIFAASDQLGTAGILLNISHRVPVRVHSLAVDWINKTRGRQRVVYQPKQELGEVTSLGANWHDPQALIADLRHRIAAGQQVMILASAAFMLAPTIRSLKNAGIPFHNQFRRNFRPWNPLRIGSKRPGSADRVAAFLQLSEKGFWTSKDLELWMGAMSATTLPHRPTSWTAKTVSGNGNAAVTADCTDHGLPLDVFEAGLAGDLDWFIRNIRPAMVAQARYPVAVAKGRGVEGLLSPPKVTVGTIHSTKGGQTDAVYVWPDLSRAGMQEWTRSAAIQAGIRRLFYVAFTRATESVVLCMPAGRKAVDFTHRRFSA